MLDEKHNDHIADQRHEFAEDRTEPVQKVQKSNKIGTFVLKSRPILSFGTDFSALAHYKLLHFREILAIDCFGDHCTLYIILGADNNTSLK